MTVSVKSLFEHSDSILWFLGDGWREWAAVAISVAVSGFLARFFLPKKTRADSVGGELHRKQAGADHL